MRHLVFVGWLAVVWVVLWRDLTLANLVSGVVIAGVVLLVFPLRHGGTHARVRPVAVIGFLGYFLWKLLVSNVIVARAILAPRARVHTGIVAVPTTPHSDLVVTLVANAISLTPGTLSIEVRRDPATLYVHVLDLRDLDKVRADIDDLQRRLVRAIGSDEVLASLGDAPLPTIEEDTP